MSSCDIPFASSYVTNILQLPILDIAILSNFLKTDFLAYLHLRFLEKINIDLMNYRKGRRFEATNAGADCIYVDAIFCLEVKSSYPFLTAPGRNHI